tara:strand:- start:1663 stop:1881 length:219 start_codon:yes stop_codon:yes gene_type:complete
MKYIYFIIAIFLLTPTNANAYLDPVSGGAIIQALIAIFAGLLTFLITWYKKIKYFITKIFLKKFDKKSNKNN